MREMYHTQEKRKYRIYKPIITYSDDAWLGSAYYFWYNIEDAHFWGNRKKTKTKNYQIYSADISFTKVLDTVFDEQGYNLWLRVIEKVAKKVKQNKKGFKPSLTDINDLLKDEIFSKEFNGVLFQDIPKSETLVHVRGFFYRKRIQLAVYNLRIVSNFTFNYEGKCSQNFDYARL